MKKNMKHVLIASGVAAATAICAGALHRLLGKTLMTVAMDRKAPKAVTKQKEKLMGSGELSAFLKMAMDNAAILEGDDQIKTVEITAPDGVRLVGHWKSVESPKRVLVAMHGWRTSWSQDFAIISKFWHDSGCCVLYAEQRGQGESGGDYMGFGVVERYDCLEWAKWAAENTSEELPIYLCGLSMGGTTVLMTADLDLPERVHGIMSDCAFTSPHGIWKHVVQNNLHIPYGLYHTVAGDIYRKKLSIDPKDGSCPEALKRCRVPVSFIHGTDDHFVPLSHTFENYKACASEKRLLVVPGADHGLSYLVDREGYEAFCKSFWREFDDSIPEVALPEDAACEKETEECKEEC
ncbi:MAG: alpha/beta hydrolase [Clostridia bacterium]|nr:alpha/beta hydrolase [Clostridia bacterium]